MPVVDVEIVGDDPIDDEVPQRLADGIGAALGAPPGRTWVRVRPLPRAAYAESGPAPGEEIRPVFVTVMERRRPVGHALSEAVRRLTDAVAEVVGRDPELVHVMYAEDGAGRVAFGGTLVE